MRAGKGEGGGEDNSQEGLDVEVVGSKDDLKEHLLVDRDELGIPVSNLGDSSSVLVCVLIGGHGEGVGSVVLAVLEDLRRVDSNGWSDVSSEHR